MLAPHRNVMHFHESKNKVNDLVQHTSGIHLVQSKYSSSKVRLGNHMSYARFLGMKFTQGSVILPRRERERA